MSCLLIVPAAHAALPTSADSNAPKGSPPHWLPSEDWVFRHWLPYDEGDLYKALDISRGDLWIQLRDDRKTVAQIAESKGINPNKLAIKLVAQWQGKVSASHLKELQRRALDTLTQGHLAQHIFFHSLHESSVPGSSSRIFGVADSAEFLQLRRAEFSPIDIGRMHGKTAKQIEADSIAVLRKSVQQGVKQKWITQKQADILLKRQIPQEPRWLQQSRYNGPPPLVRNPKSILSSHDYANTPVLSADGAKIAFESYLSKPKAAAAKGEIHVLVCDLSSGKHQPAEKNTAGNPRSTYNPAISNNGRYVAYESSAGNLNFAKRYGKISVYRRDLTTNRSELASKADPFKGSSKALTAYNPSISSSGDVVAFESYEVAAGAANGFRTSGFVYNFNTDRTLDIRKNAKGVELAAISDIKISPSGKLVAFSAPVKGTLRVFVQEIKSGKTTLVTDKTSDAKYTPSSGEEYDPVISADDSSVAFVSTVKDNRSLIYVSKLADSSLKMVSWKTENKTVKNLVGSIQPSISADGKAVAYTTIADANNLDPRKRPKAKVYLHRLDNDNNTLVSVDPKSKKTIIGYSAKPSISADGNRVAFVSDLVNPKRDRDASRGVFVYDATQTKTTLATPEFNKFAAIPKESLTTRAVNKFGKSTLIGFGLAGGAAFLLLLLLAVRRTRKGKLSL